MKNRVRLTALLLAVCALLALCACGASEPYAVTRDGITYTVDEERGTISDGTDTYAFVWSGDEVTLTYPDGSTYWMHFSNTSGAGVSYGGWSDGYAPGRYADGDDLADILNGQRPDPDRGSRILIALVLLALGIFSIVSPETAWMLGHGWRYRDAEPSDMALTANRIGGVVCILVAVLVFFI